MAYTQAPATPASARGSVTPLVAGDLLDLVDRSRESLLQACRAETTSDRYRDAHRGAFRACAALLAVQAPRSVQSRPRNAWVTLAGAVPDCAEWAAFFQSAGRRSRQAQAGLVCIEQREADDLIRQGEAFLEVVVHKLGLPAVAPVTGSIVPAVRR